jgi:hypothetical protein
MNSTPVPQENSGKKEQSLYASPLQSAPSANDPKMFAFPVSPGQEEGILLDLLGAFGRAREERLDPSYR